MKVPDGHFESFPGIRDAMGEKVSGLSVQCQYHAKRERERERERERAVQWWVTGCGCWAVNAGGGWLVGG